MRWCALSPTAWRWCRLRRIGSLLESARCSSLPLTSSAASTPGFQAQLAATQADARSCGCDAERGPGSALLLVRPLLAMHRDAMPPTIERSRSVSFLGVLRDSIVEQFTRLIVGRLPKARAAVEVRARNFFSGSIVCCPTAEVARELRRLRDSSPLVFLDAGGSWHPLRARRERTSRSRVCVCVHIQCARIRAGQAVPLQHLIVGALLAASMVLQWRRVVGRTADSRSQGVWSSVVDSQSQFGTLIAYLRSHGQKY